ncbi:unnamed protein product [Didymodactylos carnosus]|uniref:Uncharacterized protein n=1 Tax=Didymodactylos carnosus TaxID=1234261 RepID=A0A814YN77_9BILA|nr:unnamed protein product [Didymodactylos carnosus]CAF3995280.1 unnamed protein product [Didymodactylos carnosus]
MIRLHTRVRPVGNSSNGGIIVHRRDRELLIIIFAEVVVYILTMLPYPIIVSEAAMTDFIGFIQKDILAAQSLPDIKVKYNDIALRKSETNPGIYFVQGGIRTNENKSIQPLFDNYAKNTTIIDDVDLLGKLQKYITKGYFKSSTLFITFDITDLYTMLPQQESLAILVEFLHEHRCEQVNGIFIDTILELARIVLEQNAFIYGNKYYRQIIGEAMGFAFTLTLANIFMWKWKKQAILSKLPSRELYGW